MTKNEQAGLYIHVPFCLSKCGYCSFYSIASPQLIPEFVKAIVREMAFYVSPLSFPRKRESSFLSSSIDSQLRNDGGEYLFKSFDTIYIGGGTPSLLSAKQLNDLLTAARRHFHFDDPESNHPLSHTGAGRYPENIEITMEVNPGDVSKTYLRDLKAVGINRLNIGVQSFDDDLLKFLGRRHSAKEALAAIDDARKAGFQNIGLDLIYGVSGQDTRLWIETLEKALSFAPEHLSCYQLSLDEKTPLYRQYREEGAQPPSENEALDFFMTTLYSLRSVQLRARGKSPVQAQHEILEAHPLSGAGTCRPFVLRLQALVEYGGRRCLCPEPLRRQNTGWVIRRTFNGATGYGSAFSWSAHERRH